MTLPRTTFPGRQNGLSHLLVILLIIAISAAGTSAFAEQGKTGFLPLSISGPLNADPLQDEIDGNLKDILMHSEVEFITRDDAESLADYKGIWPPPVEVLLEIAQKRGYDNIAAGTLTAVGNQFSVDVKLFDLLSPKNPTYYFQTAENEEALQTALMKIGAEIKDYIDRDFRIASIAPEGNTRIDSGAILRQISTKAGDPYSPAILRSDLKKIFQMGFFDDVQIDVTDSTRGKKVVFKVVEKPVIKSVSFVGVEELKEEDVKDAANVTAHYILNPAKISAGEEAILQLYKTKGFYNSTVNTEISYPDDTGAIVTFNIDEGEKIYIKEITVEGNTTFDDDEILDEIETGEKWFLSWLTEAGLLDMNKIRQDAQRIVSFYSNHGFLEAKIAEPEIRQEEEWLYVKFIVEEGTRYKVGTVQIDGDLIGEKSELLDLLEIRKQEYLSRQIIRDDILKLTDYYAESGYAFATIKPSTQKAPSGDRMDIQFQITKGNLVYIDRITIKGNTRTRDNVIRRELKIAEGGVFDSKALRKSTQALQRLMFLRKSTLHPSPRSIQTG